MCSDDDRYCCCPNCGAQVYVRLLIEDDNDTFCINCYEGELDPASEYDLHYWQQEEQDRQDWLNQS